MSTTVKALWPNKLYNNGTMIIHILDTHKVAIKAAKMSLSLILCRHQLKGQCHEDFAVLGHFWAKIITLRLYS